MPVSRKMTHFNMTTDLMRFRGGDTKAKWIDANKKSATPCCCLTDRTEGKWGIVSICDEFLGVVPVRQGNTLCKTYAMKALTSVDICLLSCVDPKLAYRLVR